jgi:hypothetical protein
MWLKLIVMEKAIALNTDSGTEFATRVTTGGVADLLSKEQKQFL